jgi:hypothetical protein
MRRTRAKALPGEEEARAMKRRIKAVLARLDALDARDAASAKPRSRKKARPAARAKVGRSHQGTPAASKRTRGHSRGQKKTADQRTRRGKRR